MIFNLSKLLFYIFVRFSLQITLRPPCKKQDIIVLPDHPVEIQVFV